MRHFLLLGIGTSLLASSACATPPNGPLARAPPSPTPPTPLVVCSRPATMPTSRAMTA
jgi:hypothetical protein